jgi:hypothetical protein
MACIYPGWMQATGTDCNELVPNKYVILSPEACYCCRSTQARPWLQLHFMRGWVWRGIRSWPPVKSTVDHMISRRPCHVNKKLTIHNNTQSSSQTPYLSQSDSLLDIQWATPMRPPWPSLTAAGSRGRQPLIGAPLLPQQPRNNP